MIQSFQAFATLSAYRIVTLATTTYANYVEHAVSTVKMPLGITKDANLQAGDSVPVAGPGEIARLSFGDSCAVGAYVKTNALGQGIASDITALTVTGAHAWHVGVHIGPAKVEVTGSVSDVFVMPFAVR